TPKQLAQLKRALCVKHSVAKPPTNFDILFHAQQQDLPVLKKKLLQKPVRTASGVTPVAIMTAPFACPHGKCTFCPGGPNSYYGDIPQSYTGHEPTTMRAMRNKYDSYLQVFNRLEQYIALGHNCDKVELIVMGGTFTALEKKYQDGFICGALKAMNDFSELFFKNDEIGFERFKNFFEMPGEVGNKERTESIHKKLLKLKNRTETTGEQEQMRNETAKIRCVAMCIETKPDWGFLEHGNHMLEQGCTRVEIGIQSVYDDVLKNVHRGHDSNDTKRSFHILKDLGFKISAHYMPGLPLTDEQRDLAGFRELFENPDYRPDMLKLYPCMVAPGTALYYEWKAGRFTPLTADQAAQLIVRMKQFIPRYCRVQRIQRDVPTKMWASGVEFTNLRQYIHQKYRPKCACIRCREPMGRQIDHKSAKLNVQEYEANGGKEWFISMDDIKNDIILGFCRLRFPSQILRKEITKESALIRELHVYGTATALGETGSIQHKGYGRMLMAEAEKIAKQHNKNKMIVISGIGAREYYKKLGYKKEGPYMVKRGVQK
ncbi:tRNA uridine(34) 5-carboxymethylaminomethyl modification radical SAM/GNAT enzyme Elp3, partial [Candidatus Woesearchaeota archaeon]|nr:tRNA uridine(34) 5-carboxymethylaminomethyl modification radical SAM/GNAT enzyme Elp3 [Candidatus Woesearchaeota archaeon]